MLHLDRLCYQLNEFSLTADLQIAAGDRVAVIGPSGGGKSTLLNGIAGFLVPRAGQMLWNGQSMPDHPGERPLRPRHLRQLAPYLTIPPRRCSHIWGGGPLEPIKKRAPEEARFSVSKDLVFSIFYGTPERLIGQIEQQGQKAQDQNPNHSGTFPVVEFWFCSPHQEGRNIF